METITYNWNKIKIEIDVTETDIHEFLEQIIKLALAIGYSEETIEKGFNEIEI